LVLRPLNLNWRTFMAGNVPPDLLPQIPADLYHHQVDCGALIIGADATGAHIYQIKRGLIDCYDGVGFAAIGSGSRHASSEFMFAKYSPLQMPISRAMYLAYSAKKRAEAAPEVGKRTYLTALWGMHFGLHSEGQPLVAELERHYFYTQAQIGLINEQAYIKMDISLREVGKSPDDSQPVPPSAEALPKPDLPPTSSMPPPAAAPEPPESNSETKTRGRRRTPP
jgi:hypothetical protein